MTTQSNSPKTESAEGPAFELKGTVSTLTVLRLLNNRLEVIDRQLKDKIGQLPHFFLNAPVVVDFGKIAEEMEEFRFPPLTEMLRLHKLIPVAVKNLDPQWHPDATAAGLGVLADEVARPRRKEAESKDSEAPVVSSEMEKGTSLPSTAIAEPTNVRPSTEEVKAVEEPDRLGYIISHPVRNGQIVRAQQRDLVVLAPVNAGAEIIAEGHIHVYAPLRGRAMAGAFGNEQARIFCRSLEAELVSIAGQYLLSDEIPAEARGKPAQILLKNKQIHIESL